MPEHPATSTRSSYWPWLVSILLLLATMINYMDRQTLSNLSVRITEHFQLKDQQYGNLETAFGITFAIGSLFFGGLVDRMSVRLLYPIVLVGWSVMGFVTGLTDSYRSLFICRALLGFFEAGHWPCALVVTQAIMARSDRAMGNSILQSGASIGAIITPQIIRGMVSGNSDPNAWRTPFLVIGAIGILWVVAWLLVIRRNDLPNPNRNVNKKATQVSKPWLWMLLTDRRFWALTVMVICINTSWQLIRAWLPKFMQQGRGYMESEALNFNSLFYLATDVGCILSGATVLWLARRGFSVHSSRVVVFGGCALLAALTSVAAELPKGYPLLAVLLLVGAGLLGVFPCYYSFTQEMPKEFLGRMTGVLSFVGWMASSPTQSLFGALVDRYGNYDDVLSLVGWSPLVGLAIFWCIWPKHHVD